MGCATALVTPFRDGEIDTDALTRLIERQLENGVDALVIGGAYRQAFDIEGTAGKQAGDLIQNGGLIFYQHGNGLFHRLTSQSPVVVL